MKLKLKCDINGNFGFVEKYKPYIYDNGTISISAIVNVGKYIAEPYVFRGGVFVPAKQIEEEMGIDKYIKAKKPFYSVLGTGNLIVDMKIAYDVKTKEYIKDKSTFKMYGIVKDSLSFKNDEWSCDIRTLTSSSTELENWLDKVSMEVAKTGSNREEFLKSRIDRK